MEVAFQCLEQIGAADEVAWIDELVFQAAPQPLDEHVVESAAAPIHADGHATLLERSQKIGSGELRALIGVPDFGLSM
jgi:hypothetical protein